MPSTATFYVYVPNILKAKVFGAGHAGLAVDRGELVHELPRNFYVTWIGTLFGLRSRHNLSGANHIRRLNANKDVGFAKIFDEFHDTIDNPSAYNAPSSGFAENKIKTPSNDFAGNPVLTIPIPVRRRMVSNTETTLWGIDVEIIWRWWKGILELPPDHPRRSYRRISKIGAEAANCCGMVGEAMLVGGLGDYAKPPSNIFYQGANTLRNWVQKAVANINELNSQREAIGSQADFRAAKPFETPEKPAEFSGAFELPTVEEWKKASEVKASFRTGIARRKEQIAEIDVLLARYHEARASTGNKVIATQADYDLLISPDQGTETWMSILSRIQRCCFDHLIHKRSSDRRDAVMRLVQSIFAICKGFRRKYLGFND